MKVVGKFKDECMGQLMLRFIGLHAKLYPIDYEQEAYFECKDGIEKVKWISQRILQKE